jgi:hypothetical protein
MSINKIRINYSESGEILGYYPESLNYSHVPEPYIIIDFDQYCKVLHHESEYRVQNGELVDISGSVDYRLIQTGKYVSQAQQKIDSLADKASKWGVLSVDGTYLINAGWSEFYERLLKLIDSGVESIAIKHYFKDNAGYSLDYVCLSSDEAKSFIQRALSAIDTFKNEFIIEKQNNYILDHQRIKDLPNCSGIQDFIDSIDYGDIIDETEVKILVRV